MIMKKIYSILLLCLLIQQAFAQEEVKGLKQNFDITIDELGGAVVEVSMKLNASQWDYFKRNIGNNISILKREMEKALPKYFLSDFSYSEDAMERTYRVKFKTLGMASINKNGKWEGKLDSKNPDVTKLSDREFVINSDMMSDGVLMQQVQKIHLPSSAKGAKIEKDSFGKALLTYTTSGGASSKLTLFGGIALILGGGALFFLNRRTPKNKMHAVVKEPLAA
jgi:hypothetical protein